MNLFGKKQIALDKKPLDASQMPGGTVAELFNRGMAYYGARLYEQALADLKQANLLDPAAVDPLFGLGLVYRAQVNKEDALSAFEQVEKLLKTGSLDDKPDRKNMLLRILESHIATLKS